MDPWKRILKTDTCPYLVKYSLDFVLDIFNTDKRYFMKINIESSPPEIWIRIRFHNRFGSPSLHRINILLKRSFLQPQDWKNNGQKGILNL